MKQILLLSCLVTIINCSLEPGNLQLSSVLPAGGRAVIASTRTAFEDTIINMMILDCKSNSQASKFEVRYYVRSSLCDREFNDVLASDDRDAILLSYVDPFTRQKLPGEWDYKAFQFFDSGGWTSVDCGTSAVLEPPANAEFQTLPVIPSKPGDVEEHLGIVKGKTGSSKNRGKRDIDALLSGGSVHPTQANRTGAHPAVVLPKAAVYLVVVVLRGEEKMNITVNIEWKSSLGYLSAIDWPLLPFYATMCGIYGVFCLAWLIVSACQWRDLLRIQFWIGAVLLVGMLEKAVFLAEYQNMNRFGTSVMGLIQFAELLSCLKKTLARILIIIVSVGFGVVKPRLGSTLHKIIAVGLMYFVVCAIEGISRVARMQHERHHTQMQLITVPLVIMDAGICYWIFSALVGTMRTLRLRRNESKLFLYRHFTNTLALAVLVSIATMIWSIITRKLTKCLQDWEDLWIDEAIWQILFSVVLLVIMILWRPTNNNQRYAFVPLLEAMESDDEETVVSENFGLPDDMQLRNIRGGAFADPGHKKPDTSLEEDLRWVEEHLPAALADTALPALVDSDEERRNVRAEMSKMQ